MFILRLLCLIAGFSLLISCYPTPQAPLRVGTNLWAGFEPLYVARDMAFYNDTIRLKELTSATEVLRAFRQEQLEVAAVTLDEALRLSQDINDLQILLVTNISDGADRIIVRPGINSFNDLKGQRVAVEDHGVSAFMLYQSLTENHLHATDIELVPATINQHLRIMESGQVDAVVTFDPMAYQLEKEGFKVLFDSTQLPIKIIDVLVTRTSVISSRRNDLENLIAGYWQGLETLKNQPEKVYPSIAARLGVNEKDLGRIYDNLIMPNQTEQKAFFQSTLKQSLQAQQAFMLKERMLRQSKDPSLLIANWNH